VGLLGLKLTAALLIGLSLLSLSTAKAWWFRVTDFPRVQLATAAFLWLITAGAHALISDKASLEWYWLLSVAAVLAFQLWWIWPATRFHSKEVPDAAAGDDAPTLSLLSANVLMDNHESSLLLDLVADVRVSGQ